MGLKRKLRANEGIIQGWQRFHVRDEVMKETTPAAMPRSVQELNERRLVVMNQCSQTRISRGFTLIAAAKRMCCNWTLAKPV